MGGGRGRDSASEYLYRRGPNAESSQRVLRERSRGESGVGMGRGRLNFSSKDRVRDTFWERHVVRVPRGEDVLMKGSVIGKKSFLLEGTTSTRRRGSIKEGSPQKKKKRKGNGKGKSLTRLRSGGGGVLTGRNKPEARSSQNLKGKSAG